MLKTTQNEKRMVYKYKKPEKKDIILLNQENANLIMSLSVQMSLPKAHKEPFLHFLSYFEILSSFFALPITQPDQIYNDYTMGIILLLISNWVCTVEYIDRILEMEKSKC